MERPHSEQQNPPDIRRARGSYTRLRARVTAWLDGRDVSDQVKEYLLLLPDLFALLIRLMGDPRVDKSLRAQLAIVSVYVISPIDLIPDFILRGRTFCASIGKAKGTYWRSFRISPERLIAC